MLVRALIVDDDHKERIVLRYLLEQIKDVKIVGEAVHGLEALMLCQGKKVDIVFLDIAMPEMDGLEATRAIRKAGACATAPIIGLSANVFESDRVACREAGMDDFLGKPLHLDELRECLHRLSDRGDDRTQRSKIGL